MRLAASLLILLTALPLEAADLQSLARERRMEASRPTPPAAVAMPRGTISSDWFWRQITPLRTNEGRTRWPRAVRIVEKARASGKPVYNAHSRVTRIAKQWGKILAREAETRKVPLPLLIAVVAVESGGNPRAISPKGAGGLMQLMPATARRFGVANSLAPAQNVRGGTRYLKWLLDRFGGDTVLALAGYNAGEGAVDKYGGVPPFRETRDYVPKVAAAYAAARRICDDTTCR